MYHSDLDEIINRAEQRRAEFLRGHNQESKMEVESTGQEPITQKRTTRTKLFALVFDLEGKVKLMESESYADLRAQITGAGDGVKVMRVIRGREIPVKTSTAIKFF
jgi:hypothetical protein